MKELSPQQLKLLEQQMAAEGIAFSLPEPVSRLSDRSDLKLSFAQQQLWLLDQVEPGNPAYNLATAFRLTGELNLSAFKSALSEIERRHEILRTTFIAIDGEPRQVIHPPGALQFQIIDLNALAATERQMESQKLVAQEALRPFDLSRGPLFRVTLLRLDEREHLLILVMHHIIGDGWSTSILWRELRLLYGAFLKGQPSPLPELAVQYADYAAWQRHELTDDVLAKELDYWRAQLAGAPPLLELPTARPRPAVQRSGEAAVSLRMDQGLTDSLRQLSRTEGVTMFMTFAAVFALLLSRHSGQDEIVIGSPVAGRNRREVEDLIGFFVNNLVLRIDLRGDLSFRELLRRVQGVCLAAYAHQEVSFEKLIAELKPRRDQSHTPIFQVYLNMLSFEQEGMKLPGIDIRSVATPLVSKFDLTLYVMENPAGTALTVVYNPDLFEPPSIDEMMGQFLHLCTQIARDPSRKISLCSLVTPKAAKLLPDPTEALKSTWEGSIQELFSNCAKRWPDAVALKDARESFTYAELEAQSHRLANYLIASGVKRQDIIAVYAHRSVTLCWAMLGILKAGAIFCVLDAAHPDSRSIEFLGLAKPRGWLQIEGVGEISEALNEAIASVSPRCRIVISRTASALTNCSTADPGVQVGPDDLASLTFTSGSTGEPKGVLGRHQSLSHYAAWIAKTFNLNESDRFSLLSSLSHDPLQRDIFTPLQLGATLCVPDQEEIWSPGRLVQWLVREGITVSNLTPPMIRLLTQPSALPDEIPTLSYAFVVGDVLTRNDVARLRELAPSLTCINLYGTTETQRALGYYIVPERIESVQKENLPIGRGIEEVQLLVLNGAQRQCGIGELGEVYVRSPHLAHGYLHDSRLTDTRFISNPLTNEIADRLYRTGDLGRYLADGNVELSGRSDQQLQIRGFRVEPAEIETALKKYRGVNDCVVVAREDKNGDKQLVAYVVPATEAPPANGELRRRLRANLPAYMIPSAFVMMKSLPLTASGKLDRQALPAPDQSLDEAATAYVGPDTPIEQIITSIMAQLLKADHVGVHDNFFDLGGHSLLAMQLIARLRAAFPVTVPLRDLMETPTIAGLATSIERQLVSSSVGEAPPIIHVSRETEPQMSFSQEGWLLRQWWEDVHRIGQKPFHIARSVRLKGVLHLNWLEQAFNEVIRRHDVLRSAFPATKGILSQRRLFPVFRKLFALKQIHNRLHKLNYKGASDLKPPLFSGGRKLEIMPPENFLLRMVDLQRTLDAQKKAELSRIINDEICTPFAFTGSSCPLFRAVVIKLDPEEHVVIVVMHHAIADGVSAQILLRDLFSSYQLLSEGRQATLPDLPIQYQDFARWQRQLFRGKNLESMVAYWKEQFTGVGLFPELTLPFTNPSPPAHDFHKSVEVQTAEISPALYEPLKRLSYQEGVTLHIMCFGALNALLHRYTGRRRISVFAPFANRTRLEVQNLIGWFANIHVLTTECSDDLPFSELLRRARKVVVGGYAHQEVPYLLLVKMLLAQRPDYEMPQRLFEVPYVLFDFVGYAKNQTRVADLSINSLLTPPSSADAGIEVRLLEQTDSVKITVKYSTDRVRPVDIRQMLAHYESLLHAVITNPDSRLGDLPLAPDQFEAFT